MQETLRKILSILAGEAVVLAATGCTPATKKGHEQAVNAAEARWRTAKSTMYLDMAQRYFDSGDLDQAEKSLVDALSADAENAKLHLLAGRIALERGQLERSIKRLGTALRFDESLAPAHYFQGIVLQRWQRYEQAFEAYGKAYALQADNIAFLLAMSEMHVAMDRTDQAISLLEDKLTYFDQNAGLRVGLGQLEITAGDPKKGLAYLREASILAPDDLQIREEAVLATIEFGKVSEGIAELEQLTALPELADRADLRRSLARAYRRAGRLADAKRAYMQLSRTDRKNAEYWIQLGEIAWTQDDTSGALTAGSRVMSLAPNRQEGYVLAGMVWQRRGETAKALSLFDRAAAVAPGSADAIILRGITLQRTGHRQAAADAYARALERCPEDARAKRLLAAISHTEEGR